MLLTLHGSAIQNELYKVDSYSNVKELVYYNRAIFMLALPPHLLAGDTGGTARGRIASMKLLSLVLVVPTRPLS